MRELKIEFSETFRENSSKVKKTEEIVKKTESRCEELQEVDEDLVVGVDWTGKEFYVENKNGVHGRARSASKIEIKLNTSVEGWQEVLRSQLAHEYGHTYFFHVTGFRYESDIENWRHFLLEAHGQHFSEKVYPEIEVSWRTKISKEEATEKWPEIRPKMGEKISSTKIVGSRDYPVYFSYSLSYYIGTELLKKHRLDELPYLDKEEVIRAGDETFSRE